MFKKRYVAILLFMIICALTISQASAVDINSTDEIAGDVVGKEITTNVASEVISNDLNNDDEIISEVENEEVAITDDEAVSVSGYGTFTELNNLIANAGSSLTLEKDYMYDPDVDSKLESGLDVKSTMMIYGNGHTIYGNGARIMWVYSSATLVGIRDLNFVNIYDNEALTDSNTNYFTSGGAIYNNGGLLLRGCTFDCNLARYGGAIYNKGVLYLNGCNFTNNSAMSYGGAIYNNGTTLFEGGSTVEDMCWFMQNLAVTSGGAIYNNDDLYGTDAAFLVNVAKNGGAVYNVQSKACQLSECYFSTNKATQYGGATYNAIAVDCVFLDSNIVASTNYGHDMYKGVNINSTIRATGSYRTVGVITTADLTTKSSTLEFSKTNGNKFKVVVTSKSGSDKISGVKVRLSVADNNFTEITDSNGEATFSLPNLNYGSNAAKVKFSYLDTPEKTYTIKVAQGRATIQFVGKTSIKFIYGKSGKVTLNVIGGTVKQSDINVLGYSGNPKITLSSSNVVTISNLPVGTYTLSVKSTPDGSHSSSTATIPIYVVKPTAKITASKLSTYYGSGKKFTVTLKDSTNNKAMANVKVNFRIYTGSRYNNYQITTNAKGQAIYKAASKLVPGTHKVVLSYSNSRYTCKAVTTSIVVAKKTLKISATPKKYRQCGEVHIKVSDGSKPLNGIKVNLKVYTGGSYKPYNLITGFDGKKYFTDGWVLISSNEFSVGTHVVKISVVSPYYKGTAKSYLIIPASSKNGALYTGVMSNGRTFKV